MKQLMFIAISMSFLSLSGCGGGGGSEAQASTLQTSGITVVTDVLIGTFFASGTTGVQSVSCPVNTTPLSAGCNCEIPTSGAIFGNEVAGNGAVCGCVPGTGGAFSPVTVSVRCSSLLFGQALASAVLSGVAPSETMSLPPEFAPMPKLTDAPDIDQINQLAQDLKAKEAEYKIRRNF